MASKVIRDAKARVVAITAKLSSYDSDKVKRDAEADRLRAKLRKMAGPATIQRQGFGVELTDLAKIEPSYYSGGDKPTQAQLAESIATGVTKVDYGAGTSRGSKSLAAILRVTNRADARALARLDNRIAALEKARDEHISAMHERGERLTPEAIAKHAAARYFVRRGIPHSYASGGDWDRQRIERELADATAHLDFALGKGSPVSHAGKPVCPCSECTSARTQADKAAAEAERIKGLPRIKVRACPCGKAHIVPLDRVRRFDEDTRDWVTNIPVFTCPTTGTRYIHQPTQDAEAARAAKDAERLLRKSGVDWTCPDEEGDVKHRTLVDRDDDYGTAYVTCPVSGEAYTLSEIAPRAFVKWQRQEQAEREEDAA
jgi:hypothetical protein